VRKNSTEKMAMATKPYTPSSDRAIAYGYTKMISMSNMMKSIATM
jgi:hypothetical protein